MFLSIIKLFKVEFFSRLVFKLITILINLKLLLLVFINHKKYNNFMINQESNYEIYSKNPLIGQKDYYSNLPELSGLYQPIGQWTGCLILPSEEQRQPGDAVLIEVHNAPQDHQDLVGKIVNLQWSSDPQVQAFVKAAARDVIFTEETKNSQKQGRIHPQRLNKLKSVGPLESLAGARPENDVIVMLQNPVVSTVRQGNRPSLIIDKQPVQITGSIYALVTIIKREASSDRFLVRHFNKTSKQFGDGTEEIIRIPQVSADRRGVPRSTNQGIEKSPVNQSGWYIYGAKGADGVFVTQAIAPRALLQLQPDEVRLGLKSAIDYINRDHWQDTESQKGTAKTVLLDPNAKRINNAVSSWQEGDTAILMHIYGGIGGRKAEASYLGVVTGHFAYGVARVVRDPLLDELRFDIEYRQVYAHNSDGIVSGAIQWPNYMGDLQRGWLGNRPVSDVIIKFDAVTQDYNFDGIKLSPIAELTRQLDMMTARYRIGDGTGAAVVSPAASCVQDSNQALYVTIQRIEEQVKSNPRIQDWLRRNPYDLQTRRFQQLVKLGRSLEKNLVPLGIVRSDWRNYGERLSGTAGANLISNLFRGITSWRTMLPRRAHDEIATILLKNGATEWVIRTNQVGGFDPNIQPSAPTALLGHRTQ